MVLTLYILASLVRMEWCTRNLESSCVMLYNNSNKIAHHHHTNITPQTNLIFDVIAGVAHQERPGQEVPGRAGGEAICRLGGHVCDSCLITRNLLPMSRDAYYKRD